MCIHSSEEKSDGFNQASARSLLDLAGWDIHITHKCICTGTHTFRVQPF